MVKVEINLGGAYQKMSPQARRRGQQAMANQALADMNPFVPADDFILRQTATIDIDGSEINYNTPYAAKMFYMMMYNYTTPGTGPRWDNKAKGLHMKDWERAYLKGAGF
ncbi:minor capsid protein [Virgibacillus sp. YIM 98842]|uniref:minor capsid protein n=1 Tax=Virgibacillus sp. YIM 98842 TaxID=2663533 RepID=UPI0013D911A8|nr:minor capsid protein [Virgibacillus sp. YIM 98842]